MNRRAIERSNTIYKVIDNSNRFYVNHVNHKYRSRLNVVFRVGGPDGDDNLEKKFLKEAEQLGMVQLKGHRSVGGIRASMFNAFTIDEAKVLEQFMMKFMNENRK